MTTDLSEKLLGERAAGLPPEARERMNDALRAAHASGATCCPGVTLSLEAFAEHLAARIDAQAAEPLAGLHLDDLYVACAASHQDAAALAHIDARYLGELSRTLGSMGDATFVEEVRQRARERLFVAAPPARPRIEEYAGRGPLGGFVHVLAVRVALNLRESQGRGRLADERALDTLVEPGRDLELDFLKARHRDDFRAAFTEALAALPARERTLLRLQIVDGLTIDGVGTLYGVHRATAARWLAAAREALVSASRERLRERLRVSETELHSLLVLIESQVDVSVARLLRETGEPPS